MDGGWNGCEYDGWMGVGWTDGWEYAGWLDGWKDR